MEEKLTDRKNEQWNRFTNKRESFSKSRELEFEKVFTLFKEKKNLQKKFSISHLFNLSNEKCNECNTSFSLISKKQECKVCGVSVCSNCLILLNNNEMKQLKELLMEEKKCEKEVEINLKTNLILCPYCSRIFKKKIISFLWKRFVERKRKQNFEIFFHNLFKKTKAKIDFLFSLYLNLAFYLLNFQPNFSLESQSPPPNLFTFFPPSSSSFLLSTPLLSFLHSHLSPFFPSSSPSSFSSPSSSSTPSSSTKTNSSSFSFKNLFFREEKKEKQVEEEKKGERKGGREGEREVSSKDIFLSILHFQMNFFDSLEKLKEQEEKEEKELQQYSSLPLPLFESKLKIQKILEVYLSSSKTSPSSTSSDSPHSNSSSHPPSSKEKKVENGDQEKCKLIFISQENCLKNLKKEKLLFGEIEKKLISHFSFLKLKITQLKNEGKNKEESLTKLTHRVMISRYTNYLLDLSIFFDQVRKLILEKEKQIIFHLLYNYLKMCKEIEKHEFWKQYKQMFLEVQKLMEEDCFDISLKNSLQWRDEKIKILNHLQNDRSTLLFNSNLYSQFSPSHILSKQIVSLLDSYLSQIKSFTLFLKTKNAFEALISFLNEEINKK